jgi:uncharacterized protein YaiI (UPF0178 family)
MKDKDRVALAKIVLSEHIMAIEPKGSCKRAAAVRYHLPARRSHPKSSRNGTSPKRKGTRAA